MCTAFCFIAKLHLHRFECKASILFTDSQVYLFIAVQVHIKMPTWYGCMSQPGRHCVRWEPSHPPIRGTAAHPQFSARVYFGKLIAISATAEYLSYNFGHFSCKTASNLTKITETPQRRRTTLSLPELMRFQFLFESVQ